MAVSFQKLYQYYKDEEIDKLTLDELKIKASHFDLNPKLNYRLLSAIKNR